MKTAAVITEFNPFHKGHEYFLSEVRKRSCADILIAVMSGDFVQRGEPAVIDKYLRTEAALKGGCDIVLELPVRFCLSSAGGFAQGAIHIIDSLGIVDELWFGSECGQIESLCFASEILDEEPEDFRSKLQSGLKEGLSYPAARSMALSSFQNNSLSSLLNGPNNILGIEYCTAAKHVNSRFTLHTLKRTGSDYNNIAADTTYPSALAIRSILFNERFNNLKEVLSDLTDFLPDYSAEVLKRSPGLLFTDDFSEILRIRLLDETAESLCSYLNMTPDLALRIKNLENDFLSFSDFTAKIKSRNYTWTHVSRALMSVVLKLPAKGAAVPDNYIRLLGLRESAKETLHRIHEITPVKLIASPSKAPSDVYREDFYASSLYESIRSVRYQSAFIHENSRKFLKI